MGAENGFYSGIKEDLSEFFRFRVDMRTQIFNHSSIFRSKMIEAKFLTVGFVKAMLNDRA